MKLVEVEGTLAELRDLQSIPGLGLPSAARDRGGGRFTAVVMIDDQAVLDEIERRGLKTRITLSEQEVEERIARDEARLRRTSTDEPDDETS